MSLRIPVGFGEGWWSFVLGGDAEPMLVSLGLNLQDGLVPSQTATNTILDSVKGNFAQFCGSQYTVFGHHMIWGADPGDITFLGTSAGTVGLRAANSLPNNCATLVKKTTALGGRRNRGRMFVPGLAEGDVDNVGALSAGFLLTAQTQAELIRTNLSGLTEVDSVVLLHQSAPFDPTVITALVPDLRIGTQRRRMRP